MRPGNVVHLGVQRRDHVEPGGLPQCHHRDERKLPEHRVYDGAAHSVQHGQFNVLQLLPPGGYVGQGDFLGLGPTGLFDRAFLHDERQRDGGDSRVDHDVQRRPQCTGPDDGQQLLEIDQSTVCELTDVQLVQFRLCGGRICHVGLVLPDRGAGRGFHGFHVAMSNAGTGSFRHLVVFCDLSQRESTVLGIFRDRGRLHGAEPNGHLSEPMVFLHRDGPVHRCLY